MRRLLQIDPDVKAVVSSGYADDPVMSSYKDYGFLHALPKPYTLSEMKAIIDEIS